MAKKVYIDELPNPDAERAPIVKDMCEGCNKIFDNSVCKAYADPSVLKARGGCYLKSNREIEVVKAKYSVKRKFKRSKI